MTDFSSPNFVHVGPTSDWSWSSANNQQQVSKTPSNNGWSTTWDVPTTPLSKNISWNSMKSQTPSTPSGWSTTWDVPTTPEKSQKPVVLVVTPNTKVQNKINENTPKVIVVDSAKSIIAPPSATSTPIKSTSIESQQQQQQDQENQQESHDLNNKSSLYKTELCRSWMEKGICKYGHKCQFAHGEDELRIVVRHPKYKTEFCKTFTSTGICPYGNRCRFIHPSVESDSNENSGNNKSESRQSKNSHHQENNASFQSIFSPNGSITPPEMSASPVKTPFELNDLILMLPTAQTHSNTVSHVNSNDDSNDVDHRLSFFKHLTEI